MASTRGIWKIPFILHLLSSRAGIQAAVTVQATVPLELIVRSSEFLCTYKLKQIYVYFGNETSISYPSQILKQISDCGISYVSFRNKYKDSPLEDIKDDGVLMFLVMIQWDAMNPIELTVLQKKSAAKHLSHVLLLIQNPEAVTKTWLRSAFKQFWRIWLLNIVILYWRNEQLHIYRYNPFRDDYLIRVRQRGTLPQLEELFPKQLPNMHGKPLRMCMYADDIRAIFTDDGNTSGSDGIMSDYIAERLNATRIVHHVSKFANTKSDICLEEIEDELDDIAMNIRFLALHTFSHRVEHTIVHRRDDLCVLVPKAKTDTIFWNLFRSFNKFVWLAILLTLLVTYAFYVVAYRQLRATESYLLQLVASTLSMPLMHIPLRTSLRLFLFCWMFYGMLISSAFKGNLMSNLLFRKYLPDINTMKELALSPYKLLMFERHVKHLEPFLNASNPYENMIRQKMTIVPDETLLDHILDNNLSYAYLEKNHIAWYQVNERRHTRFGRQLYHKMSTCIVPFHAVFIVPYGSPYLGFVNTLVRSSHEFGLSVYWERKMSDTFLKSGRQVTRNHISSNDPDDPVVLTLAHFQAAFCVLAIGLIVSFVAFLCEIMCKKL